MPFLLGKFQNECLWYHKHPPTPTLSTLASFLSTDSCRRACIFHCKTMSNTSLHSDQLYFFKEDVLSLVVHMNLLMMFHTLQKFLQYFINLNVYFFSFCTLKHMLWVALIILVSLRLKQMQHHKCTQVMSSISVPLPYTLNISDKTKSEINMVHHTYTQKNKITSLP